MTVALFYGAGSGALHAVTGPDHVLSLAPAALERPRAPSLIGLSWGLGHALGTLVLAVPALLFAELVPLALVSGWGDRLAGAALIVTALLSLRASLDGPPAREPGALRRPLAVGFVHGVTGAGSLLLLLPMMVSGTAERALAFLAGFSVASTLAMAGLTAAIARLGRQLEGRELRRAQLAVGVLAALLGASWLVG